jgi:hypothetical protein
MLKLKPKRIIGAQKRQQPIRDDRIERGSAGFCYDRADRTAHMNS